MFIGILRTPGLEWVPVRDVTVARRRECRPMANAAMIHDA
jgi:hypothetical protein